MDIDHRPSTVELSAELDGAARRALDATVPFASRKEVERYSQLPALMDIHPTHGAQPPEPSPPDTGSQQHATGVHGEIASRHMRSSEGLCIGGAWSGSAQVSGFSTRDTSSAFILGWDTPPMVANWSHPQRDQEWPAVSMPAAAHAARLPLFRVPHRFAQGCCPLGPRGAPLTPHPSPLLSA